MSKGKKLKIAGIEFDFSLNPIYSRLVALENQIDDAVPFIFKTTAGEIFRKDFFAVLGELHRPYRGYDGQMNWDLDPVFIGDLEL